MNEHKTEIEIRINDKPIAGRFLFRFRGRHQDGEFQYSDWLRPDEIATIREQIVVPRAPNEVTPEEAVYAESHAVVTDDF